MALSSGMTLGHYEIRSKLGAGGMGEVYLAQDTKLDRKVALKILPAELASNRERMERFVREAKSAAALNHPNIAHVYEIGESQETHFIAMEFIDGAPLRDRIHRDQAPLAKLHNYLNQVEEGLAKAHSAGIVHRDMKPDNIMITSDDYAKILDFGLAKLIEAEKSFAFGDGTSSEVATAVMTQQSIPGTVMGKVGYMSPEQAQGRVNEIDHRSDIFSFGCILFEAAAGQQPFKGKDALDSLHKIVHESTPSLADFNPNAPPELQRIVRRCLAKDADKRYQSIKDVSIELKELRDELKEAGESDTTVPGPKVSFTDPQPTNKSLSSPSTASMSSAEYLVNGIKRNKVAAVLLLLISVGLVYGVYKFGFQPKPNLAHFQKITITRVTNEGNVETAAVSPDGKYIAYSLEEDGKRSLWTKHLGTGSRVQIVPTAEVFELNACTFSADGGYVYYTRIDEENPRGALYQVPVLGGIAKKILLNVSERVSISPNGKEIAFGRDHLKGTESEIFLANIDGTNERLLLSVKEPDWLGGATATWAPDGKTVAVSYGSETLNPTTGKNLGMSVALVTVPNGSLKPLGPPRWLYASVPVWFSDGSGLAFVGREQSQGARQIWQVSYPQGEAQRITSDLHSYSVNSLTLTSDSSALVAVQGDAFSNIWVAPANDSGGARVLTSGKNAVEGLRGLAWTSDGRVIYESNINGKASLWMVHPGGGEPKAISDSTEEYTAPEVSPDGQLIFYGSLQTGGKQIWRMNPDGANAKQLTRIPGGIATFSISSDGKWVVYNPFVGGISKVSIDGDEPIEIIAKGTLRYPQMSPDGTLLAYLSTDERTHHPRIVVVKFADASPVKTIDLPVTSGTSLYETLFYHGFHWSPDGRALVYINTLGGVSNLWSQPFDGGKPVQITNFKSDRIINFAYSRDGRQIAFSRGNQTSDAVMISEVK